MASSIREESEIAARLVADAGGEVVGKTRLQKIAYLLEAMNFGSGLDFEYKHYGPYSEQLSSAIKFAEILDLLKEEVRRATWGGTYSIFRNEIPSELGPDDPRKRVVSLGNSSDPVELELAATAVFLASEGRYEDPWAETERRKPEKATSGRLERAKRLLDKFRALDVNEALPAF